MNLRGWARRLRAETELWSGRTGRGCAALDGTRCAVLMYHRVLPREVAEARRVEPGMFVTPDTFERHLDWLLASGFRVLPLAEIVEALEGSRPLPPRACAITFDDGWRDNADHAFPALAKRDLPATIFLVTERVGTTGAFWPDEVARWLGGLAGPAAGDVVRSFGWEPVPDATQAALRALKQISEAERPGALERLQQAAGGERSKERELLDWDEVQRLSRDGISFESHGATHAILTRLEQNEDVQRELRSARETLRARRLGNADLLAYPSGAHDERVRGLAKEAGYRAAFATRLGLATSRCDRWALPRIGLHDDVSSSRAELLRALAIAAQG